MASYVENSEISDYRIEDFKVVIDGNVKINNTVESYIAGVVAKAKNSSFNTINVLENVNDENVNGFSVEISSENTINYIGGVVAYLEGTTSSYSSVANAKVNIGITNVKVATIGK